MKSLLLSLWIGTALLAAPHSERNAGQVDIALDEMKRDTVLVGRYLISDVEQKKVKIDTLLPGCSAHTYVAETDTMPYKVLISSTGMPDHGIKLVLFPGDRVSITGSVTDYQVEGSGFNARLRAIQYACRPYEEKMDSLYSIITEEIYNKEYLPVWRQRDSVQADYIRRHPDDDLSLFLLGEIKGNWIDELYPLLTLKVKSGPFAPIAQVFDKGQQRKRRFEANRQSIKEGIEAPGFTLRDIGGKKLSLSSLRGKYVVLDFWGSWCGWCVKGFPDMKAYYEKYKGKLEMLGIDCNDTEEKWRAAVAQYELPWLHVRDDEQTDVRLLYAVQGYPTKVVVDPDGRIARIFLGENPTFYQYLDELFN